MLTLDDGPHHFSAPLAWLAISLSLATSCASLHPPVDAPHRASTFEIHPHRADPDGLALRLVARDVVAGGELEIWRREDGGEWHLAEALDINQPLADALSTGRVEWRDPLGQPPVSLQYRMYLHQESTDSTDPVDIRWRGVPEAPSPRAEPVGSDAPAIRLSWEPAPPGEVHVHRRDVLGEDDYSLLAVVDPSAGDSFDDDEVDPGGVYAYRLRFVDTDASVPRHGAFSESLYVSLPDP